jgi:hypothetical protein
MRGRHKRALLFATKSCIVAINEAQNGVHLIIRVIPRAYFSLNYAQKEVHLIIRVLPRV